MLFGDVRFYRYVSGGGFEDTDERLYALAGPKLQAVAEIVRQTSPETEDWEVQRALSWVCTQAQGRRFERWLRTTSTEELADSTLRDI